MQRSKTPYARLCALALAMLLLCASMAHAAQPVTVTVTARQADGPNDVTFHPVVTPLKPGAKFFYTFELSPKNDPSTPMTLTVTFDKRLSWFTVGGSGACIGPDDATYIMTCRDQFLGTSYLHMSVVWVWFTVLQSPNNAPLEMVAVTANDRKTLSLAYDGTVRRYLPVMRR